MTNSSSPLPQLLAGIVARRWVARWHCLLAFWIIATQMRNQVHGRDATYALPPPDVIQHCHRGRMQYSRANWLALRCCA